MWYDDGEAYWELLDQVEILDNPTPKAVLLFISLHLQAKPSKYPTIDGSLLEKLESKISKLEETVTKQQVTLDFFKDKYVALEQKFYSLAKETTPTS